MDNTLKTVSKAAADSQTPALARASQELALMRNSVKLARASMGSTKGAAPGVAEEAEAGEVSMARIQQTILQVRGVRSWWHLVCLCGLGRCVQSVVVGVAPDALLSAVFGSVLLICKWCLCGLPWPPAFALATTLTMFPPRCRSSVLWRLHLRRSVLRSGLA